MVNAPFASSHVDKLHANMITKSTRLSAIRVCFAAVVLRASCAFRKGARRSLAARQKLAPDLTACVRNERVILNISCTEVDAWPLAQGLLRMNATTPLLALCRGAHLQEKRC